MRSASAAFRDERPTGAASHTLEPAQLAWLAVLPCAALVVAAIVLLGPPLGHAFFGPAGDRFWPEVNVAPEPVEHARYAIALLGGPLAAAAIVLGVRRPPRLRRGLAVAGVHAAQLATVAFVALAVAAQHELLIRSTIPPAAPDQLLTPGTLLAAAALASGIAALLWRPAFVARMRPLLDETGPRRLACAAFAVLLIAIWLLAAFNTERSAGRSDARTLIPWEMSETFAVLNGRSPLLDFHSQYAQLVPYLAAAGLRVVGTSMAAWTGVMVVMSGGALLAIYALLRRVAGGSLPGLAVFVPFLAGSGFLINGAMSPFQIFSLWPMRYGGPYLLAWLTTRHLDGAAPRRRVALLAAGGLVALNNAEFGLPALGATIAALAWVEPPRSLRSLLALARDAAGGLLAAGLLVTGITLLHGGALPRFGLLFEFAHIFGVGGWILEPMAAAGFHLALYGTYTAAIVVATVRAVRGEPGRALTGMLVWSGVFGLGSGSYYVGRSDVLDLVSLFSAWCLALVLLTIVVVRRLAAGARPSLPDLVVLLGWSVALLAVFMMPRPWAEIARLQRHGPLTDKHPLAVQLVRDTARRGERVAIFIPLGHRIAEDVGVVNVMPYAGEESIATANQFAEVLREMRRAAVTQVYVEPRLAYPGLLDAIVTAGFSASSMRGPYVLLTLRTPSPSR